LTIARKTKGFYVFSSISKDTLSDVIPSKTPQKLQSILSLVCIFLTLLFSSAFLSLVYADEINLKALALTESSNNPRAVSFLGPKYGRGLFQVSEVALADYLKFHKEQITPDDLFNPSVNERVCLWLLTKRIPQILKHLKRPVSIERVLSAYNKGYKGKLAKGYISKYKKNLRRVNGRGQKATSRKGNHENR
jgi:hypothetical protein